MFPAFYQHAHVPKADNKMPDMFVVTVSLSAVTS